MVRFLDQPIKIFVLISGAMHIMLLGSLSLRYRFPDSSLRERLIPVLILESSRPETEPKPIRETLKRKKIQITAAKQEAKKLPEPGVQPPPPLEQPQLPDSNSPVKLGGLGAGNGAGREIALAPGGGIGVSGGKGPARGEGNYSPNQGKGEKGFRLARPIQTVKASYPPMALRLGMEADVELKIQVDAEGRVTKVEVVKSAGMGFDEEAIQTVQQFRFEPAKKDDQNIASEFTYIYRFRLEK